eukprot:c3072_g1_i1.p1 GENE.c3072_g1_i1~~c3072_g1_i1.p1  ORF type:complete len:490 (+),score=66.09 c3072_g1_i1:22-1491(+)
MLGHSIGARVGDRQGSVKILPRAVLLSYGSSIHRKVVVLSYTYIIAVRRTGFTITIASACKISKHCCLNQKPVKSITFVLEGTTDALCAQFVSTVQSQARLKTSYGRHAVIANPFSGKRKSIITFHQLAAPILQAAGVPFHLFESEYPCHATEIASQLDPSQFSRIVCSGGDGFVAEILNGNMNGPRLPMCVLPTGSDNSTCASLGMRSVFEAILVIIKGEPVGFDLGLATFNPSVPFRSETGRQAPQEVREKKIWFHSVCSFGVMGEAAEEISALRWMGPFRTTFVSFRKLCHPLRVHKMNLRWRPHTMTSAGPSTAVFARDQLQGGTMDIINVAIGLGPGRSFVLSPEGMLFPHGDVSDGALELLVTKECTRLGFVTMAMHLLWNGQSHISLNFMHYTKGNEVWLDIPDGNQTPFNIDGEVTKIGGPQTVHVVSHPQAIQFIAPMPNKSSSISDSRSQRSSIGEIWAATPNTTDEHVALVSDQDSLL